MPIAVPNFCFYTLPLNSNTLLFNTNFPKLTNDYVEIDGFCLVSRASALCPGLYASPPNLHHVEY